MVAKDKSVAYSPDIIPRCYKRNRRKYVAKTTHRVMTGANGRPMKPERFAMKALGDKRRFLAPLLVTPDVGVAVLDNGLRFQVINRVLAATNGIPVKAHIGKTVRHVLGPAAEEVEPRLRRTFATGRSEFLKFA